MNLIVLQIRKIYYGFFNLSRLSKNECCSGHTTAATTENVGAIQIIVIFCRICHMFFTEKYMLQRCTNDKN